MSEFLERHLREQRDEFLSRHPRNGEYSPSPRYYARLAANKALVLDNDGIPYGGNPPAYERLELSSRLGIPNSQIVQSLPSPGHTRGEFIGLTDNSNRSYSIQYQVIPSTPPPTYIDSTINQTQDVIVYPRSQSRHHLNRRSSTPTLGTSARLSRTRGAAPFTLHRTRSDSPVSFPLFDSDD